MKRFSRDEQGRGWLDRFVEDVLEPAGEVYVPGIESAVRPLRHGRIPSDKEMGRLGEAASQLVEYQLSMTDEERAREADLHQRMEEILVNHGSKALVGFILSAKEPEPPLTEA